MPGEVVVGGRGPRVGCSECDFALVDLALTLTSRMVPFVLGSGRPRFNLVELILFSFATR